MSTAHSIQTIIEALIMMLLLYGFIHEEKVIAFEKNCKRIIVGNYRRYKRKKRNKIKWKKTYHCEKVIKIAM